MYIIPMRGNLVDMAVVTALRNKAGHPVETVRSGSSARASKRVALVCERPDVLIPTADSIANRHVSLVVLVDPGEVTVELNERIGARLLHILVETVCVGSVTGLCFVEPGSDTVGGETPEHDADGNTRVLDGVRNAC